MKFRTDFVTNSSSSSFIVIFELENTPSIEGKINEEFGKFGTEVFNRYQYTGEEVKTTGTYDELENIFIFHDHEFTNLNPDMFKDDYVYFFTDKVSYTSDGETDSEDYFLLSRLDDARMIYEEEGWY